MKGKAGSVNLTRLIIAIFGIGLSLFQILTATFGVLGSMQQRAVHLSLALGLSFFIYPLCIDKKLRWHDWFLAVLGTVAVGYVALNSNTIIHRFPYVTPLNGLQLFMGVVTILLLLEASRRLMGNSLPLLTLIFVCYVFVGPFLPHPLKHSGFDFSWTIDHLIYTPNGVYGLPLGVSATYVSIFVIFGSLLAGSGGGDFFTNFASSAMGRYRGGPAKVAVVASGIFGMISGAASANVVTTGSVTIPLMRRTGYDKDFAAATEAAASTGGELAPPIMGAAAFILAELTNIPYGKVVVAAIIPAVLYYLAVFFAVDLEAVRLGLSGLSKDELPNLKKVLRDGFLFIVPVILIMYMIFVGYTPLKAGAYAFFSTLAVCYVKKATRLSLIKLLDILQQGSQNLVIVAVACATAGIIVGVVGLTGIGLKLTEFVVTISGGNLFVGLLLSAVAAIILGMGMPASAAYIVEAILVVPALIDMGAPVLAANLFVFYFAVMSAITPPVAVAAFAAAGLAGSNPLRVGWKAMRLAIPAYIVPFMFVYAPQLLGGGSLGETTLVLFTSIIGVYALAAAGAGFMLGSSLTWPQRILSLVSALLLIFPGLITDSVGLAGFVILFILVKRREKALVVEKKHF